MWDVIVSTCQSTETAISIRNGIVASLGDEVPVCDVISHVELHIRQRKGILSRDVAFLVVEDPKPNVGSGSATLNALLCVAEYLAAKEGLTVSSHGGAHGKQPGRGSR